LTSVFETGRLALRQFSPNDAEFILELLNEPSWIRFIGDKNVRTLDDARNYLVNGPIAMYERVGFGLFLVALKSSGEPVGMCGLIKRDTLEDVDIGFAFLPRHWGKGYAFEAAEATMNYGREVLKLKRIVAITSPDNDSSIKLIERIGLKYVETRSLTPGGVTKLFAYPA
jgi:RimJ/RimL family protein N-acetyltransferase